MQVTEQQMSLHNLFLYAYGPHFNVLSNDQLKRVNVLLLVSKIYNLH